MRTQLSQSDFTDLVSALAAVGTISVLVVLFVAVWLLIQANMSNILIVIGPIH